MSATRAAPAVFDHAAVIAALDRQRAERGLDWNALAVVLHEQSVVLNDELNSPCMCQGALIRTTRRDSMSCQYALILLRWLGRPPEDFLVGEPTHRGEPLPPADDDHRLRFDLPQLHAALNARRSEEGLTWSELGGALAATPARLTNLRTARLADMGLTMRVTQWLGQPATAFIYAARW